MGLFVVLSCCTAILLGITIWLGRLSLIVTDMLVEGQPGISGGRGICVCLLARCAGTGWALGHDSSGESVTGSACAMFRGKGCCVRLSRACSAANSQLCGLQSCVSLVIRRGCQYGGRVKGEQRAALLAG